MQAIGITFVNCWYYCKACQAAGGARAARVVPTPKFNVCYPLAHYAAPPIPVVRAILHHFFTASTWSMPSFALIPCARSARSQKSEPLSSFNSQPSLLLPCLVSRASAHAIARVYSSITPAAASPSPPSSSILCSALRFFDASDSFAPFGQPRQRLAKRRVKRGNTPSP